MFEQNLEIDVNLEEDLWRKCLLCLQVRSTSQNMAIFPLQTVRLNLSRIDPGFGIFTVHNGIIILTQKPLVLKFLI